MANHAATVSIDEAAQHTTLTIRVTGIRRFRARFHVTALLLRLAAWMCPVRMELEVSD